MPFHRKRTAFAGIDPGGVVFFCFVSARHGFYPQKRRNSGEVDADVLANFVQNNLLTDENSIRYVVSYHRSFGRWVLDQLNRLKAALGNNDAKTRAFLDKAARLYHEALAESAVRTGDSSMSDGYAHSISNTRYKDWNVQVEDYFNKDGSIKSSESLYLGTSDGRLAKKGIVEAPLYVPTSVINKAVREPKGSKSGHSLTKASILALYEGIKNAPIIVHNPARNALVYITSNKDTDGNYIIASFDLNNNLFGEIAHKATSIHGRQSILHMLENLDSAASIFIRSKNEFNRIAGLQSNQSSKLLAKVEPIDTIYQTDENVNGVQQKNNKNFSVVNSQSKFHSGI